MSKIAINNEIVLMRQAVRQSRVSVVRKLIKEAKLLQSRKHGDEKIREKCKRKAQRLVAEIAAIKKIKDDEISKFGITETRKLQEILNDLKSEPNTRVMARLVFHKILQDRIIKFREKFPEYEEHLGPGRKKLSKLQRKANRDARNALKSSTVRDVEKNGEIYDKMEKGEVDDESEESSNEEDNFEGSEAIIEPLDSKITGIPEHEEYLGSGRKKLSKLQKKDNKQMKNSLKLSTAADIEENSDISDEIEKYQVDEESKDSSNDEDDLRDPEAIIEPDSKIDLSKKDLSTDGKTEIGNNHRIKTPISTSKKRKNDDKSTRTKTRNDERSTDLITEKSEKSIKTVEKLKKEKKKSIPKISVELKKPRPIRVISKEASVKRFTDLLEDKESQEVVQEQKSDTSIKKSDLMIEKQVDSFFMTENGESEYMSVVVPKLSLCENEEQDDRFGQNHAAKRQKNFHEKNNKFFSKIDQRNDQRYGDKYGSNAGKQRSNNNSNIRGSTENYLRPGNDPARFGKNFKREFEKKSEPKDEELHPSWAARKKQQEILKQGFQGKKIVFDD